MSKHLKKIKLSPLEQCRDSPFWSTLTSFTKDCFVVTLVIFYPVHFFYSVDWQTKEQNNKKGSLEISTQVTSSVVWLKENPMLDINVYVFASI